MKNLSMIVSVEKVNADEFRVHVQHDVRASFSRAVDPRAKKAAMQSGLIRGGETWALIGGDYGQDGGAGGRCTSTITFRKV